MTGIAYLHVPCGTGGSGFRREGGDELMDSRLKTSGMTGGACGNGRELTGNDRFSARAGMNGWIPD